MNAVILRAYGPPDVVELREVDTPADRGPPGARARARVVVNPADWYVVRPRGS